MNIKKTFLLSGCIIACLTSCNGGKGTSTVIPMGDEAPEIVDSTANQSQNPADPELIADRVNAIYEAVAAAYPEINDIPPSNDELDDAFCSSEWKTLVEMVNAKDAENMGKGGFFDADYWIMGQDWGKISISDLKVSTKDDTHADASFILTNLGSKTKVRLEMIFERGEWLIGNFIDESHKLDWKKSMKNYLEEKGKKAAEEKADDGIIEYDVP